jgi:hypothetical protein
MLQMSMSPLTVIKLLLRLVTIAGNERRKENVGAHGVLNVYEQQSSEPKTSTAFNHKASFTVRTESRWFYAGDKSLPRI